VFQFIHHSLQFSKQSIAPCFWDLRIHHGQRTTLPTRRKSKLKLHARTEQRRSSNRYQKILAANIAKRGRTTRQSFVDKKQRKVFPQLALSLSEDSTDCQMTAPTTSQTFQQPAATSGGHRARYPSACNHAAARKGLPAAIPNQASQRRRARRRKLAA
jgi:hypothetical protein